MKTSIYTILSRLLAITLLLVTSFCSKPGSDPNPVQQPPTNPVQQTALIMPTGTETKSGNPPSPTTSTQTPTATATTTQVNATTGITASLNVNYSNLNGAVGGVYAQVQGAPTYFSIPLSGTASASGKITIPVGIPTNLDNGSFTIVISIYDTSGRVSNTVNITITIGTTTVATNGDPYKDGDPYANDYFIEYYENGDFHSLNYITSPVSFTYQGGYPIDGSYVGCKRSSQSVTSTYIPCAGSGECDKFSLSFVRDGWDKVPKVGEYTFSLPAGGNAYLQIDGASNCVFTDKPDTYIKLSITEVKVVKDYGPVKSDVVVKVGQNIRGYFTGEFEAILYGQSFTEAALGVHRKSIITKGRFKLPMGGPNAKLNGTGTIVKNQNSITVDGKIYPSYVDCNYKSGFGEPGFSLETYTEPYYSISYLYPKQGTVQLVDETNYDVIANLPLDRPKVRFYDLSSTEILKYTISGSVTYNGSVFSGSGTFIDGDHKTKSAKVSFTGTCK